MSAFLYYVLKYGFGHDIVAKIKHTIHSVVNDSVFEGYKYTVCRSRKIMRQDRLLSAPSNGSGCSTKLLE